MDGGQTNATDVNDHVVGVVIASDLDKPEWMHAPTTTVGAALRQELPRVHTDDEAASSVDPLRNSDVDALVVLDKQEHIVGRVTAADV